MADVTIHTTQSDGALKIYILMLEQKRQSVARALAEMVFLLPSRDRRQVLEECNCPPECQLGFDECLVEFRTALGLMQPGSAAEDALPAHAESQRETHNEDSKQRATAGSREPSDECEANEAKKVSEFPRVPSIGRDLDHRKTNT